MVKYPADRDPTRNPDFPNGKIQRTYVWDQWNRARQNRGLPRVDPPRKLGIAVTMRPPKNSRTGDRPSNESISYNEWRNRDRGRSGPLIDGFNRQREQQNARNDFLLNTVEASDMSVEEQEEVHDILRQVESGSIPVSDSNMSGGGVKRGGGPQGGPSSAPPNPATEARATAAAGTSANKGSDGGFDSAQGPESFLPTGGYRSSGGTMSFTKVHRMKSFAIPYVNMTNI